MARIVALSAALATACGDRRDVDRTFPFNPPHGPTLPEAIASIVTGQALDDALTFVATTDPATISSVAGTISQLPDALLSYLADPGDLATTAASAATTRPPGTPRLGAARPIAATSSAASPFAPSCLAATGTSLTYTGCRTTTATGAGASVITLDGSVQRTDDGVVTWSLVEAVTVTTVAGEAKRVVELTGAVAVAAGGASGWARSDAHTIELSPGRIVTSGWATFLDLDLATDGPTRCISGGVLELRKIWTERSYGAPTRWPFVDGAFRFRWSSCGTFVVARSF